MVVETERFGTIEVTDDRVIAFPEGLLGFSEARRFTLVDTRDSGVFYWLQSVDDPSLAFLTVVPWPFFPDYEPELPEADQQALGITDEQDALVLCLLTVQREERQVSANLLGPLVVNQRSRVGRQLVLAESGYPLRAPLAAG